MKPELLARALVALLLAAPPALAQDPAPLPEALPVVEEPVMEDEDEEVGEAEEEGRRRKRRRWR